jgi:hypothetical protein
LPARGGSTSWRAAGGFGKTRLGIDRLVARAIEGLPVAWCGPTYKMLHETWDILKHALISVTASTNEQEHRLVLRTGGSIDLWSLDSPDVVRGRAYSRVVIDEAAMVRDLESVWEKIIRPTLTDYRGDAWFLSTPRGLDYFHTLYRRGLDDGSNDNLWRSWQFPTSANPYLPADEIEMAERELPDRTFAQEFMAEFMSHEGAVFRRVREALSPARGPIPAQKHRYIIGCDRARTGDYTAFVVIDATDRSVCCIDRFRRVEYHRQLDRLRALVDRFHPAAILAEENSMGGPLIEQLQRDGLPIWPFATTHSSKQSAIDTLVLAFERGAITLLEVAGMDVLVNELLAFTAMPLPSGLVRYGAPDGQHDDAVMATAIGWQAAVDDVQGGPDAVFGGHFNRDRHVAEDAFEPERGWPITRGIDISHGLISIIWFSCGRMGSASRSCTSSKPRSLTGSPMRSARRCRLPSSCFPVGTFRISRALRHG